MTGNMNELNRPRQTRLKAPEDLTDPQALVWYQITQSVPDWHFTAQHMDLIRRYCVLVVKIREYTAWWNDAEEEGPDGVMYFDDNGIKKENPKMARLDKMNQEMANLAYKLRILPQEQQRVENAKRKREMDAMHEAASRETQEQYGDSLLYTGKTN